VANKEKKTASELENLVMIEIRKHSELRGIQDVGVALPRIPILYGPTWECFYVADGAQSTSLEIADEIVRKLQNQFDLIF